MSDTLGVVNKYVINPLTQKAVKVGGKTFSALVRDGVFNNNKALSSVPENKRIRPAKSVVARTTDRTQAYRLKTQLEKDKPLPTNKLYSVGNDGKTIVVKNKKAPTLKPENIVSMMSRASMEVNKKLMKDPEWSKVLSQDPDNLDAKTRETLEQMILQELVANGRPMPVKQQKSQQIQNQKISTNNIREVKQNAKRTAPPTKRFIVSQDSDDASYAPRKPNPQRKQLPLPTRRHHAVFSDTDQLTTDAYETNADEEEDDDDDGTEYADYD
jgi:hypothetical protein